MNFSKEDQLIIQCARGRLDAEVVAATSSLLQQDLDWEYILDAAILHGVAPLVYRSLSQVTDTQGTVRVPLSVWETLQQLYSNNVMRNRRLYHTIGEIVKALKAENIEVMGLKDFVLGQTIFSDIGLRPMGDIDILIHKEDYDRFVKCMADLGFSPLPSPDCPYLLKYAWALHFHRPADDVWVDVQWGVLQLEWDICGEGNFDLETERMWHGAYALQIADYEIWAPRPEDMLFHLCMHLEGHRYAELILFSDIVEFIRYYGENIDRPYFVALARKYGVEGSLYYALFFVERLFCCSLPFSLKELEPAYFKADLFAPVFGNLATLHETLDDIDRTASPLVVVMEQLERIVRHQTVCSMRGYGELTSLADAFNTLGAEIIVFDGDASQRVFPSQSLSAFSDIYMFTLQKDRPLLEQALVVCGFMHKPESVALQTDDHVYIKHGVYSSVDPALHGVSVQIEFSARFFNNLDTVLSPQVKPTWSKKDIAFQALVGALHQNDANAVVPITLNLVTLSPEEALVYFAARVGQGEYERLFKLCALIEFFRCYQGEINWKIVGDLANRYGLASQVYVGLLINALLDQPVLAEGLSLFAALEVSPRLFNWARYGPTSLERYTSFKPLFYCVFSLFSTRGFLAKFKYLLTGSDRRQKKAAWMTCVVHVVRLGEQVLMALFRKKKTFTAKDFAYWTYPEPPVEYNAPAHIDNAPDKKARLHS